MQKYVHLVDLVKSFPTNIYQYLQTLASIQPRTSLSKFGENEQIFNPPLRSVTLAPPPYGVSMPAKVVKKPVTFVSRVTAAEALIGKKNILEPKAAKEFLMANSSTVIGP